MKRQIFALCMVLGLAMASVVLADSAHPNRTARDQAYLSSGSLLPNSTGNASATITGGGVISTSGSQPTHQPLDTTAPAGQDPLHPNRTARDQAYASGGSHLADNSTNSDTAIASSGVSSSSTEGNTVDNGSVSSDSSARPLPQTASDLPLLGLLGALSLAGALALRATR